MLDLRKFGDTGAKLGLSMIILYFINVNITFTQWNLR